MKDGFWQITPQQTVEVTSVNVDWPLRGITVGPNKGGAITSELFSSYGNIPKREALQVVYLALCYMILFSGYYYVHTFVSVTFNLSFVGFALQYFFYALASLVAPSFGRRFGIKVIVILSSFGYILYSGSIISGQEAFYLVATSIVGTCSGFIWLQQGIIISDIGNRVRTETNCEIGGALSGLFYGIFNFCFIFGNLLSLIVFLTGVETYVIQWTMFGVCCVGVIMLLFIRVQEPPRETHSLFFSHFKDRVKAVVGILRVHNYWLVVPSIILQAAQISITYQVLPRLIDMTAPTILTHIVTFIFYGCGAVISSLAIGKIYDQSAGVAWGVMSCCELASDVILLCVQIIGLPLETWWIVGFMRGASDYSLTTIISSIGIRHFKEHSTPFFASYRLLYCVSYVPLSILTGYIPFYANVILTVGLWIIASVFFCIFRQT